MSTQDNNQNRSSRILLVNPNLGHPLIMNIDPKLKTRAFQARVLFVSNIENPREFQDLIDNSITFIPIIEHKWKLKVRHDKKKEIKKPKLRNRIKFKLQKLIRRKKKTVKRGKFKPNLFRGEPIKPLLYDVEPASILSINEPSYLLNEYNSFQNFLKKHDTCELL